MAGTQRKPLVELSRAPRFSPPWCRLGAGCLDPRNGITPMQWVDSQHFSNSKTSLQGNVLFPTQTQVIYSNVMHKQFYCNTRQTYFSSEHTACEAARIAKDSSGQSELSRRNRPPGSFQSPGGPLGACRNGQLSFFKRTKINAADRFAFVKLRQESW